MPAQPIIDDLFELEADDVKVRGSNAPVGTTFVSTVIVDAAAGEQLVLSFDWELNGLFAVAMNNAMALAGAPNNQYTVTFVFSQVGGGASGSLTPVTQIANNGVTNYSINNTQAVPAAMVPGIYKLVASLSLPAPWGFVAAFEDAGTIQIR